MSANGMLVHWIALSAAWIALSVAITACGGCDTPTGSCRGVEFGVALVLVVGQEGAPVPNVRACGAGVCGFTQTDGVTEGAVRKWW